MSENEIKDNDVEKDALLVPAKKVRKTREHERVPMHKQRRTNYALYNLDEKKYYYRWGTGTEMRIKQYLKAGYTQHLDKNGKPYARRGTNDQVKSYLMKIPLELYNQDQEAKLDEPRSIEEAMGLQGNKKDVIVKSIQEGYTYGDVKAITQIGAKANKSNKSISN